MHSIPALASKKKEERFEIQQKNKTKKIKIKIETDNKTDKSLKKTVQIKYSVINMNFVWKLEILHVIKTNRI